MKTSQIQSRKSIALFYASLIIVAAASIWGVEQPAAQQQANQSFFMSNALWFKANGDAEKYAEYIQAIKPLVIYAPKQLMIHY